ncbi:MAG: isoamylase early set domain-containing protein [Verrucomicrobia bacterium]|nr:isoamylase early set domain-containing protein [Verrucomicrobiota bacterium]
MSRKQRIKSTRQYPNNGSRAVEFRYEAPMAKQVHLAGDFNDWNFDGMPMHQDDRGVWRACVPLSAGRYEYRFIVDGDWQNDPHACGVVPNEFGSCNCVVEVGA